jgi:hypothetical protein
MRRIFIATAVAALLIIAMAAFADRPKAVAQTGTGTPQPTSSAHFFSAVAAQLHVTTHVPVYLPASVPFQTSPLYATVLSSASTSYVVELSGAPSCNGGAWCHLGTISGYQSGVAPPLSGTSTTTLTNGTVAYLNPTQCGASCGDSTYTFLIGSYTYIVGVRGNYLAYALTMANSMQLFN